ncbi:MAG: cobalamin biosynthesis protein CbiD [Ruminococcus sp.]|nr:cobalamin biosynthesis protein CbiD [Ruminococcus sp.]
MNEQFIYQGTKKLRCGYTTGSCAAGAAKAAAEMLLTGRTVDTIDLATPSGVQLRLDITDPELHPDYAVCSIKKDSGDDPDVTGGMKIYASVSLISCGIEIIGGDGVGTVTKAGLDQPVGEAAINSVPRKMIKEAVSGIAGLYGYSGGFRIVISVPGGEEIAKKTFNPRMGITGGISIIGTTGIVEPMSSSAIVGTIRAEAGLRRAAGYRQLILTVGNYSGQFVKLNAPGISEQCVTCSNFIGDALDIGVSLGFESILLIGHIGKLVKLGAGIMNTHSSAADGRMETLIACAALAGADISVLRQIAECVTTDAALDVLFSCAAAEKALAILTERIERYLCARVRGEAAVGAVIFSDKHSLILKTCMADSILGMCRDTGSTSG